MNKLLYIKKNTSIKYIDTINVAEQCITVYIYILICSIDITFFVILKITTKVTPKYVAYTIPNLEDMLDFGP